MKSVSGEFTQIHSKKLLFKHRDLCMRWFLNSCNATAGELIPRNMFRMTIENAKYENQELWLEVSDYDATHEVWKAVWGEQAEIQRNAR